MSNVADSVVSILEQSFKVTEKVVKIHKEAREHWLDPATLAELKDNSFKSERPRVMSCTLLHYVHS
jgi:hypothetical protein